MESDVNRFMRQVIDELVAMEFTGLSVPLQAYDAALNPAVMTEYVNMSVSACADLLRELYPAEGGTSGQV